MGMESVQTNDTNEVEDNKDEAKKWLEFVDEKGMKTQVGVFGVETDEDALARARSIDARMGKKSDF